MRAPAGSARAEWRGGLGVVLLWVVLTAPGAQAAAGGGPLGGGVATGPAATAPVPGPVLRGFEPPAQPYGPGHRGVDLRAVPGEPVVAALAGTVAFAGTVAGTGWVTVDHGGGLDTTYGPLDPRLVERGRRVAAGTPLGRLAAAAAHLDWGARLAGAYIDPLALLQAWRPRLVPVDAPPPARPPSSSPALPPQPENRGGGRQAGEAGPRRWPLRGPITSGFGWRTHPVRGVRRPHAGLDIAAPTGTPVRAASAGRVRRAGAAGGYGLLVEVDAGAGVHIRYGHLSRISVVVGQAVAAGTVVGAVGSSGTATGPHLHFEVRRSGVAIDPLRWLP